MMSSERKLERVVITGAGSGLGRAIALEAAARGSAVFVSDIRADGLAETVELVKDAGGTAFERVCDVSDREAVEAMIELAFDVLGGVDLLVNNAGVAVAGRIGDVPLEDWEFVVNVNLWGVIYGCHFGLPRMRQQGSGCILNVASAAGLVSSPKLGPYNVTKSAVISLSETLHTELLKSPVEVRVLCPTFFATNLLDGSRTTEPKALGSARRLMEESRYTSQDIARAALDGVVRGDLYIVPMLDGRILWRVKRITPNGFSRLMDHCYRWITRR
jgi:NAD(P)-dependent dehydrogenase (short-subunit alcohol dehydrogenase family)